MYYKKKVVLIMSVFSERLRSAMVEKRVSYGELSKVTGIPKSALQRYATGETEKVPMDRVQKIARALGLESRVMVGWESPKRVIVSDEDIKFALFGGEGEITDAQFEEVKRFARFIRERDKGES